MDVRAEQSEFPARLVMSANFPCPVRLEPGLPYTFPDTATFRRQRILLRLGQPHVVDDFAPPAYSARGAVVHEFAVHVQRLGRPNAVRPARESV